MKTLWILCTALLLSISVHAQQTKEKQMTMKNHMKDCVMMENGKMLVMQSGKTMPMDKEMTMSNGTRVMPDGKVMMKDGSTMTLKDGDCVYMNGKMGSMHMKTRSKMDKKSKTM